MRLSFFGPIAVFLIILCGFIYVAVYEKPPVPGKLLPKTPQAIKIDGDALGEILKNGPWVSPGLSGRALYKLGFRSCPDCINYENTEFADLHGAKIDTRVILYARRNKSTLAERAIIADLTCTKEWPIYLRWMEDVPDAYPEIYGMPPAPTDPRRAACLEAGRKVRDQIGEIMKKNGWEMEVPALFWQTQAGEWRVFLGDDARGKRLIRRELNVRQAN